MKSSTEAVAHYLATGEADPMHPEWPGQNFLETVTNANTGLRDALIEAVLKRVKPLAPRPTPTLGDLVSTTRSKVSPMVNGLFPADERSAVLAALERSVVFLTPENIESILRTSPWLSTCWDLANIYLLERGSEPLSPEAPAIVGMSEETTCYLSLDYLDSQEREPYSDYLVHEAAHVFHNCKRSTIGLNETRSKDFLLNIDYRKRETFAYSCEAYSRILSLTTTSKQRSEALEAHSKGALPGDNCMDLDEYLEILAAAIRPGNGWKRILKACAPSR